MNVVQPQFVLMAAGMWTSLLEVRLFPWMETGRHPGREKHVKAGRWEVGGRGERGRGMFLGQAGGVDEDREHSGRTTGRGSGSHERTLTVRPESPGQAQLARRPVEAGVAFTLS